MEDKTPAVASPEYDHLLMISALLLLGLGLVMVFSASGVLATDKYHDPTYFLKKQFDADSLHQYNPPEFKANLTGGNHKWI